MVVNHGALEPTKICVVGRIEGSSTSVPMATWTKVPSRTTEYSCEPQRLQCASWPLSSPKIITSSSPAAMLNLSCAVPANDLKAEPVARRQFEQWQFKA